MFCYHVDNFSFTVCNFTDVPGVVVMETVVVITFSGVVDLLVVVVSAGVVP